MTLTTSQNIGLVCMLVAVTFGVLAGIAHNTVQNKKDDPACSCGKVEDTFKLCVGIAAAMLLLGIGLCVWGRKKSTSSPPKKSPGKSVEMTSAQTFQPATGNAVKPGATTAMV